MILELLDRTRDETLRHFALGEAELNRTYGPGKWSVRFVLHHLADSELVLLERVSRILGEGKQVLRVFHEAEWARGLDYGSRPVDLSRNLYGGCRAMNRYYAERYYETRGHQEWVHSEMGLRTLKDEIDKVADHNEHHLRHIRLALAQTSATTAS